MTLLEIIEQVRQRIPTYGRSTFYRDMELLQFAPVGIKQRPQQWPANTAAVILHARGFNLLPEPQEGGPK